MKTVIEPFRIKAVEPIRLTSAAERNELLQKAGYNLFQIPAQDVTIDFLTDSGTAALSSEQWSALMRADESYAGAASFYRFQRTVQSIFGFRYVLPVHQGRAGERLLFRQMAGPDQIVPSNTHFDTTRANIESLGAIALDLPCALRFRTREQSQSELVGLGYGEPALRNGQSLADRRLECVVVINAPLRH